MIGYGLVVGLDGSGDQTTQTPFTTQAMLNMPSQLGRTFRLETASNDPAENVAAVVIHRDAAGICPSWSGLDVTVSSIGNAKSLRGGTPADDPLKAPTARSTQWPRQHSRGWRGRLVGGNKAQVNHLSAGRIANGATVERAVPMPVGQGVS